MSLSLANVRLASCCVCFSLSLLVFFFIFYSLCSFNTRFIKYILCPSTYCVQAQYAELLSEPEMPDVIYVLGKLPALEVESGILGVNSSSLVS